MSKHNKKDKLDNSAIEPSNNQFESWLRNVFGCNENETWANLEVYEWITFAAVIFFTFLMPFLYSRTTTENFLTPKEFFTKMMIPSIAAFYFICKLLFSRGKIKIAKTPLDMPLFLFVAFMGFTLLFCGNAVKSGVRDLREVISVLLLFPIIVNVFKSRWQVDCLLWTFVATGLLTSIIGIMETYNWYFKISPEFQYATNDIFNGIIDPKATYIPFFPQLASKDYAMTSVVSTFGNRNYLGTFAMFTAFIPIGYCFYYKKLFAKLFSFSIFGILMFGLTVSRCRAALVGIVIGAIFMAFIMFLNYRGKGLFKKYSMAFTFSIIAVIVGVIGVTSLTLKNRDTISIYDKIRTSLILDRSISNVYERMWVWYANDKTFFEKTRNVLFGMGFGTFKHFFPLKESEYLTERNRETFTPVTFRQAHNDWIQILSELGIVGLILFLFLLSRFFSIIQLALRKYIYGVPDGKLKGEHIILIALLAAMVSQLLAAIPDFPFHRIETAVYAVIILAVIPVITETGFYSHEIYYTEIKISNESNGNRALISCFIVISAFLNLVYEYKCWCADEDARSAEMCMKQENYPAALDFLLGKDKGVNVDSLPGDPYLKLSAIYERAATEEKDQNRKNAFINMALSYSNKANDNINFNARSTYHSVTYRELHIYYHVLGDLNKAREKALDGLSLTAGDARSIYNFYLGKIDLDLVMNKYELNSEDLKIANESIENLQKAAKIDSFAVQSNVFLAMICAKTQKWELAKEAAQYANNVTKNTDAMLLNIEGISLMNLGQYDKAEEKLLLSLNSILPYRRNNIDKTVVLRDLGFLYIRKNELDKAEKYLKEVINSNNVSLDLKNDCERLLGSIGRK